MFHAPEQFAAINKAHLEAAIRLGGIALDGAERMLELHLKTAKSAFADVVRQAKAFSGIKDIRDFAQLNDAHMRPMMEKATGYTRGVYDVASAIQSEINKLVEEQLAEFNKLVVTGLDKVVKSAPAGSEVAVAAVKSAISAVNAAYDNLSKSASHFAEITQANVEAATQQTVQASKKKAA
jgi:phasin family protein